MEQLIDSFGLYLETVKKASVNTISSYKRDLKRMALYMENRGVTSITDVTEDRLFAYINSMQEEHCATSSIIRSLTSIKAFFRFLLENGNIQDNPAEAIKAPKAGKTMPRIMSAYEIESLLSQEFTDDAIGKRDKAILEIMYATGLRTSELVELELGNIDMSLNCLRFGQDRVIPYGQKAKEALNEYLLYARDEMLADKSGNEQHVFVNYKGIPMSRQGLWKLIKTYVKRAGIDMNITPYSLRHSFTMHLIENGADLGAVQEMMGISDASTLSKYARAKGKNKDPYEWARIRN
ncbi:MAG: tyrosine-type recombinase/integrase [Butyrivibrio sp.]|uniref:tyrosine-type recombinase/integrase n=1 Tax=Butyrivibrio sp. TaxID=28121 RepID=UPI0025BA1955|nr:tyrosine-type recombinase/integrase [Butyrivibrio sp.]MBQ6588078.1 tyrosine-type recombinase/integrase [Butyrivibrio sp.]